MSKGHFAASPVVTVLVSTLCWAGVWTYVSRIMIPHQKSDAALHDRPRGNLSDLYPRWLGARELLLHGRDPYSPAVTREIQAGYYGRVLDPSRAGDPKDQQGFAYPIYVAFGLAPTIRLPFDIVRSRFLWLLAWLTITSIALWLRVLCWSPPLSMQITFAALALGSIPVMQGLKLQQLTLFVVGLLAIAMFLLSRDLPIAAGIVLACATIKPQLVWLLLLWLALWTLADLRHRYRWAASFLLTMALLCGASEWYLPHWIPRFVQAAREYKSYTDGRTILDALVGMPYSIALELLILVAVVWVCWRERRRTADARPFVFTLSLTLAATLLLIPTYSAYNQVLLFPALLLLVRERKTIWGSNGVVRVVFLLTAAFVVWPWVSAVILAGLSFFVSSGTIWRTWAVPFWTVPQTPVAVAALMLINYYQRTFRGSAGPSSS